MKKTMKMALLGLFLLLLLAGCKDADKAGTTDVAMTVEDKEVTVAEVNMYVHQLEQLYEAQYAQYGEGIWAYGYGGQTIQDIVKDNALEAAKMMNAISVYAESSGIVLAEDALEQAKADAKTYFDSLDPAAIEEKGLTLAIVEKFYVDNKTSELVMERELADFTVDEARLEEQLAADADYQSMQAMGPEAYLKQVRARHVLVSIMDENNEPLDEAGQAAALEEAEEVLALAKALEPLDAEERTAGFIELVAAHSDDPGSKETGGEYTFGKGAMVPEFEEAAFGLEPGEVSGMVKTTYGYHILLLEEIIPPTQEDIDSLLEYQEYLVENYKNLQKQEAFDALYAEWIAEYDIEIREEALEAIVVKQAPEAPEASEEELQEVQE